MIHTLTLLMIIMNNLNTPTTFILKKTVISETMIHSVIMSIAEIKILTTSTTTV